MQQWSIIIISSWHSPSTPTPEIQAGLNPSSSSMLLSLDFTPVFLLLVNDTDLSDVKFKTMKLIKVHALPPFPPTSRVPLLCISQRFSSGLLSPQTSNTSCPTLSLSWRRVSYFRETVGAMGRDLSSFHASSATDQHLYVLVPLEM